MRFALLLTFFAQSLLAAPQAKVQPPKAAVEPLAIVKGSSHINFVSQAKMLGIASDVKGKFTEFSGEIKKAANLSQSSVTITVAATSIDTDNARRDRHLRKKDFFEVKKFPNIVFTSTKISLEKSGQYKIEGRVTVKDKTTPMSFLVTATQKGAQWEITGAKTLSRNALGITYKSPFFLPDVLDDIKLDFKFLLAAQK